MRRHLLWAMALMMMAGGLGGCAPVPPTDEDPFNKLDTELLQRPERTYRGLAGQTVAVMVWADWRTRTEYSRIQVDLARQLEQKLTPPPADPEKDAKKPAEPAPTAQFLNPASVVRYQREHPEIEGVAIAHVASRLGVARVIYIEIEEFEVQSPQSMMLLRGSGKVTLRVVEVHGGVATVAFEETGIATFYPHNAPEGVVQSERFTPRTIYDGLVARLAAKIALRIEM